MTEQASRRPHASKRLLGRASVLKGAVLPKNAVLLKRSSVLMGAALTKKTGAALVKTASELRRAFGMMELTKGRYFGSVMMTNALECP